MLDAIPTTYTEPGQPAGDDDRLVAVRLPADVADELMVVSLWLSLQLSHRLPLATIKRALLLNGITNALRVLDDLRTEGPCLPADHLHGMLRTSSAQSEAASR